MFVILVSYKKPLTTVDEYLSEHVRFLDEGYQKNYFIVSGKKNPRTGGVIFSQLSDRQQLEKFLKHDPFYVHEIADYEIIEFHPSKYHANFKSFLIEDSCGL